MMNKSCKRAHEIKDKVENKHLKTNLTEFNFSHSHMPEVYLMYALTYTSAHKLLLIATYLLKRTFVCECVRFVAAGDLLIVGRTYKSACCVLVLLA